MRYRRNMLAAAIAASIALCTHTAVQAQDERAGDRELDEVVVQGIAESLKKSRDTKRDTKRLQVIAIWILAMRLVDYYWHVAPEFHNEGLSLGLLDIGLPLALGGVFLTLFAMQLRSRPILPINDPGLAKALTHHTH